MDSLARRRRRCARRAWRCTRSREQDSTDLEKCLYSVEAPLFLGLGFLGGRIDHQLAAMNALVKLPGKPVVLIGGEDLCFLCPPELALDLPAGTRVSLFPMAPVRGPGLGGAALAGGGAGAQPRTGRIGTSNVALGGPVRVGFDAPRVLVDPAREPARAGGRRGSGAREGQARLSVMVTASASVIVTSTRAPAPSASAKLRSSGGTTARRVRPSGVRKVARPLSRS